jgi:hypothetical protein
MGNTWLERFVVDIPQLSRKKNPFFETPLHPNFFDG